MGQDDGKSYIDGIETFRKSVREITQSTLVFAEDSGDAELQCCAQAIEFLIMKNGMKQTVGEKFYHLVIGKIGDDVWKNELKVAVEEIMTYSLPKYLKFDWKGVITGRTFDGNSSMLFLKIVEDLAGEKLQHEDVEVEAYEEVKIIYKLLLNHGITNEERYNNSIFWLGVCAHFKFKRAYSPFSTNGNESTNLLIKKYETLVNHGSIQAFLYCQMEYFRPGQSIPRKSLNSYNYEHSIRMCKEEILGIIQNLLDLKIITNEKYQTENEALEKWAIST